MGVGLLLLSNHSSFDVSCEEIFLLLLILQRYFPKDVIQYSILHHYMGIFCTCSSVIWVSKGFNMQMWGMNIVPVVSNSIATCRC